MNRAELPQWRLKHCIYTRARGLGRQFAAIAAAVSAIWHSVLNPDLDLLVFAGSARKYDIQRHSIHRHVRPLFAHCHRHLHDINNTMAHNTLVVLP